MSPRLPYSLRVGIIIAVLGTSLAALCLLLLRLKGYLAKRIGDVIFEGFGPASADYSFELPNGFALFRSSSISRSVTGPMRWTGPRVGTEFWVEPDVTYLGWNERFIVCFQDISELGNY